MLTSLTVRLHDRACRWRQLRRDETGLTMLAYALGVAVVVVPLAVAIALFGTSAVDSAKNGVDTALNSP